MKNVRRGLALLLTVAMLVSVSVVSFAEEPAENNLSVSSIEKVEENQTNEESVNDFMEEGEDVVAFNLGTWNVLVGHDAKKAEEFAESYQLFENDGSYTIQLENDAFFPYEVQFTYDGKTVRKWFETPESSVEINGHTFYVASESEKEAITQIGVWVGNKYIAAYPKEKEFTDSPISTLSLLPLEEREVNLSLRGVNRYQLMNIKVSAILSLAGITAGNSVVWIDSYDSSDSEILQQNSAINLLDKLGGGKKFTLVVGDTNQLNAGNIRYIVTVTDMNDDVFANSISIYTEKDGARKAVTPNTNSVSSYENEDRISAYLNGKVYENGTYYIGGLQLMQGNEATNSFKIYEGKFKTAEEIDAALAENPAIDVTEKLMTTDMTQENAGYQAVMKNDYFSKNFTTVNMYGDEKVIRPLRLYVSLEYAGVEAERLKCDNSHWNWDYDESSSTDVDTFIFSLGTSCSASKTHFLQLKYYTAEGTEDNSKVTKAVLGHFNSLEEAENANRPDIKEWLFSNIGYDAIYAGKGVDFTVFAEDAVYKITVIAEGEYVPAEDKDKLNEGSSDTYFNVKSAAELENAYVVPREHDSYFDAGYQTVLYLDDVDSSALRPTFRTGYGAHIYSGHNGSAGVRQESGVTVADFSNGAVKYAAASENGKELRNYFVTFQKKQTGGAKLFVNGINGDDGATREVFLTSAQKNIHDIFIANIGDQPLTGLNVRLKAHDTVMLDDYWTVGGTGNDTLAAFTTTRKADGVEYGELPNVAKIRLVPNSNIEGEIDDDLIISADGQEDVVIHLTGHAGDPRLTTEEIPDAVKYVPYGVQILHNNKYDWNKVTMKIESGSLPEGVTLKPNGEIYGVPKETGTFKFSVRMKNSDSRFKDQTATYTLNVKENTNENVDAAADVGYTIKQRLGTRIGDEDVITEIKDEVFVSNGELGEFVGFWLNGEKLTEGVDYDKESGSTRITIRSQTFKNKAKKSGTNTIAAEFRVDGNAQKALKRTPQNFTMNVKNSGNSGNSGTSHGSSNKSNSSSSANQPNKNTVAEQPIVETPTTIIETIEVPAAEGIAAAENDAVQSAMNRAMEKDNQTEEKELIQIALKVTGLGTVEDEVKIVVPEDTVNRIAKEENASMKLDAGKLGSLTLSHTALQAVADAGKGDLTVSLKRRDNTVETTFVKGEKRLSEINGGVKIAFGGLNDGEVIVLIKTDGAEEIVKKSVVADGNVYALISGSGTVKVIYNAKEFADVAKTDWYYKAVNFVNGRELFVGINDREFAPNMEMNRAMLAAVLHRLENGEAVATASSFKDVLANQWYTDDIAWAESNGIISGYGNGLFGVEDKITIEQLAMILYRYAGYIGIDTVERGKITKFHDAAEISLWANDAVRWAVGTGLLNGDGTNLNPKAKATRAQVAAVMMRFIENMVK